jgi:hypothetical protein
VVLCTLQPIISPTTSLHEEIRLLPLKCLAVLRSSPAPVSFLVIKDLKKTGRNPKQRDPGLGLSWEMDLQTGACGASAQALHFPGGLARTAEQGLRAALELRRWRGR